MYKIQTLNKIAKIGLDVFGPNYECGDALADPEGMILRSFAMHDMELPNSLLGVARAGAGTNNIPIDKCSEKGIVVFNTPGANANAVKELVIAAMLLSSRNIVGGINWAKTLTGDVPALVEKGKGDFVGPELAGKTLGVVGLGAIGVMVCNAAQHLGMEVMGYDPYISVDSAWGLSRTVKKANDLKTLLQNSDYISIHVPLTGETKMMFNKEAFAQMKKGARLLNLARGELVNNADLAAALDDGAVAAYVTDFPDEAMVKNPKVVAIPHLGASTPESEDNCAVMAAHELKDFLENGNIKNSVNFPNCDMGEKAGSRISICHENKPNMLTQIANAFANKNINISKMLNASKGNFAYTLMDVDGDIHSETAGEISGIDGVIRIRVI